MCITKKEKEIWFGAKVTKYDLGKVFTSLINRDMILSSCLGKDNNTSSCSPLFSHKGILGVADDSVTKSA